MHVVYRNQQAVAAGAAVTAAVAAAAAKSHRPSLKSAGTHSKQYQGGDRSLFVIRCARWTNSQQSLGTMEIVSWSVAKSLLVRSISRTETQEQSDLSGHGHAAPSAAGPWAV
jgi:hypothetical protein